MARDIDYAAVAVKNAITEKFGRHHDLTNLEVIAGEREMLVRDGDLSVEGTRDDLLAAVRAAETYEETWRPRAAR